MFKSIQIYQIKLQRTYMKLLDMLITKYSDYAGFKKVLDQSYNIMVLTGAGISAESGIPVYRGPGGLWRTHQATDLETSKAFDKNPGLVWEFYHYRRNVAFSSEPNKAHKTLKLYEDICKKEGRLFTIVTQNVDGLHVKAGSENVLEIHGSLRKIRCTICDTVVEDIKQPLCEALKDRGDPNLKDKSLPDIKIEDLPKCIKCKALMRPHIVWFGESLDLDILEKCDKLCQNCSLCIIIGTSSVVFPAARFASEVAIRGQPVAEFNVNKEPASSKFSYYFEGLCGSTLPKAFGLEDKV